MYNGVGVPRLNEGNWRPRNFVFPLLQLVISPYYCHSTTAAGATLLFVCLVAVLVGAHGLLFNGFFILMRQ